MYKELLEKNERLFEATARFRYFKNEKLSLRYYANYLSYLVQPSLDQWQEDLAYVQRQQADYPESFAHFFFAENAELSPELKEILQAEGFDLSKHIVFTNQLANLKLKPKAIEPVHIQALDQEWLPAFMAAEYASQLQYGQVYADQMKVYYQRDLLSDPSSIYIAIDGDHIVGAVTAWTVGDYVEIDDYHVDQAYQGRGIGTALQLAASRGFERVILISEEHNRQMYEHQGYVEVGYYWTALKK